MVCCLFSHETSYRLVTVFCRGFIFFAMGLGFFLLIMIVSLWVCVQLGMSVVDFFVFR